MRSGPATLVSQSHARRRHALAIVRSLTDQSLLLIILDDLRRANLRVVRVTPDVAKGTSLAQEVPALIQFHLTCASRSRSARGVPFARAIGVPLRQGAEYD